MSMTEVWIILSMTHISHENTQDYPASLCDSYLGWLSDAFKCQVTFIDSPKRFSKHYGLSTQPSHPEPTPPPTVIRPYDFGLMKTHWFLLRRPKILNHPETNMTIAGKSSMNEDWTILIEKVVDFPGDR